MREFRGGVGRAVGLTAVFAALFFDSGVELCEAVAFALGVVGAAQLGVSFGEIEMHFRAAGVNLRGGLQFLQSILKFS